MYSCHKNVQILLALLKKWGIKHIVVSAGTRHICFAYSALRDGYFKCYSIVDERSAGFFALGLIQTLHEPVAITCTSGTAACNYLSAVTEAYYQHLPLLVLTADRLHCNLNQQEDQCVPQMHLYQDVVKKMVDLPVVRDDMDAWYCGRLVNEALLELDHREKGPVHINFQADGSYPIPGADFIFNTPTLPDVRKIDRVMADDDDSKWEELAEELSGKRVILVYGQNTPISQKETKAIDDFCERYDVIIFSDIIGNCHAKSCIKSPLIIDLIDWDKFCPDIIISMGGHTMTDPKGRILKYRNKINHWHVSRDGCVSDHYRCQTKIIECSHNFFFEKMASLRQTVNRPYYESWRAVEQEKIPTPLKSSDFEFSSSYVVKKLMEDMQSDALFHISNSNGIRLVTCFETPENIEAYCNRGAFGIDGSMSAYVAQSYITRKISYLVIGDLSFFYDMNALWNKYISGNTRILLLNNHGGAIVNREGQHKEGNIPGGEITVGAEHNVSAKGWVESLGFTYLTANDKKSFEKRLPEFLKKVSNSPILFEVFTDMDIDNVQRDITPDKYRSSSEKAYRNIKGSIPKPIKEGLKKLLGKS